jgi:hypothetical protein
MRQEGRKVPRKKRPHFFEWLEVQFSSPNKRIDGLWIGIGGNSEGQDERLLARVEEALFLIKRYDRLRYDRLSRNVRRVWVHTLFYGLGTYNDALAACELDARFVLDETTSPELIAATIVHEATHLRLLRCGIGYEQAVRARVEAVCFRRELAFAAKLPNGEQVKQIAQRGLETAPGFWTDAEHNQRNADGQLGALRQLGAPDWFVRGLVAARAVRLSIKKQLRRSSTRGRSGAVR